MKYFDAPAQRFTEEVAPDRHDHEFLKVHGTVGVRAAVEDVHHRAPAAGWRCGPLE